MRRLSASHESREWRLLCPLPRFPLSPCIDICSERPNSRGAELRDKLTSNLQTSKLCRQLSSPLPSAEPPNTVWNSSGVLCTDSWVSEHAGSGVATPPVSPELSTRVARILQGATVQLLSSLLQACASRSILVIEATAAAPSPTSDALQASTT